MSANMDAKTQKCVYISSQVSYISLEVLLSKMAANMAAKTELCTYQLLIYTKKWWVDLDNIDFKESKPRSGNKFEV